MMDDNNLLASNLHVVGSGHRGTAARKLIVVYIAEIQN